MNYIKNNRLKNGLTLDDFSKKIKISPATISRWETFKAYPDFNQINKMEKYFKEKYYYRDGSIGGYLKYLRSRKGLKSHEVADLISTHKGHYSRIENNKVNLTTDFLLKFNHFLDADIDEIVRLLKIKQNNEPKRPSQ